MRQNTLESLEYRALGSRCRRLSEYCYDHMRQIYSALNIQFDPTWFAYISHLHHTNGSTVQQLADELGVSQPAASKMIAKLESLTLLHTIAHPQDKRMRMLQLTAQGQRLWKHITPALEVVNHILRELDTGQNTLQGINALEQAFAALSFKDRVLRALATTLPIELKPYDASLHNFYEQHNRAWVSKYFHIEPIDDDMLRDPQTHIIATGGKIYVVHLGTYSIGGFTLLPRANQLELSKMYVPESLQGYGYGNIILQQAIAQARTCGAHKLCLLSNRSLAPAINLYRKHGFQEIAIPPELANLYQRANIMMECEITNTQQTSYNPILCA